MLAAQKFCTSSFCDAPDEDNQGRIRRRGVRSGHARLLIGIATTLPILSGLIRRESGQVEGGTRKLSIGHSAILWHRHRALYLDGWVGCYSFAERWKTSVPATEKPEKSRKE